MKLMSTRKLVAPNKGIYILKRKYLSVNQAECFHSYVSKKGWCSPLLFLIIVLLLCLTYVCWFSMKILDRLKCGLTGTLDHSNLFLSIANNIK